MRAQNGAYLVRSHKMSFRTVRLIHVAAMSTHTHSTHPAPCGQKRLLKFKEKREPNCESKMYAITQNKGINSAHKTWTNEWRWRQIHHVRPSAQPSHVFARFFSLRSLSPTIFQVFLSTNSVAFLFCTRCFCRAMGVWVSCCVLTHPFPGAYSEAPLFVRNSFGIWSSRVYCCYCWALNVHVRTHGRSRNYVIRRRRRRRRAAVARRGSCSFCIYLFSFRFGLSRSDGA